MANRRGNARGVTKCLGWKTITYVVPVNYVIILNVIHDL